MYNNLLILGDVYCSRTMVVNDEICNLNNQFFIDKKDVYDEELKSLRVTVDTKTGMRYSFTLRSPHIDR